MCFIYCRICIGKHESLTNHTPLKKVLFSVFSVHGWKSFFQVDGHTEGYAKRKEKGMEECSKTAGRSTAKS
jgi:hypothetical protein